jgi:peptide/nickel transport system substrate-binding protein
VSARPSVKTLIALLLAVGLLGACTSAPAPRPATSDSAAASNPSARGSTITWGYEQEFSGFNPNTPEGATLANIVVLNAVLGGFWQFGPDGTLVPNTDFGSYQKVDDSPLTVRYTINPRAVWSDGVPVTCDDIALAWLAGSGATGPKGFAAASTAGMQDMNPPVCSADGRTATVRYRRPYADWRAQFGVPTLLPAHVVARQGGVTSIRQYLRQPRSAALAGAIAFYNKGWALNPGELKKELMPSSGPYVIDSWAAGQSLTLKANPRWWGTPPSTPTIVIRFIGGAAQPQALRNGEIQIMNPQPQVDLMQQLRAMGDSVRITTGETFRYEHLDFRFRGVFADRSLREAFAKCVPRQVVVDRLIRPFQPDAQILQSRFVYPFQADYERVTRGGGQAYATVDLAGSRRLLAGRTPTVRIGWAKDPQAPNRRRADTVALVQESCGRAGFRVVDAGSPTFLEREWVDGNYDLALFGWGGSPLVAGGSDFFGSRGGNNTTGYASVRADRLLAQLARETDRSRQVALLHQIDALLWADVVSLPLYAVPSVLATAPEIRNVRYNATLSDLTWNVAQWARS